MGFGSSWPSHFPSVVEHGTREQEIRTQGPPWLPSFTPEKLSSPSGPQQPRLQSRPFIDLNRRCWASGKMKVCLARLSVLFKRTGSQKQPAHHTHTKTNVHNIHSSSIHKNQEVTTHWLMDAHTKCPLQTLPHDLAVIGSTDACYSRNKPGKHYARWKKALIKGCVQCTFSGWNAQDKKISRNWRFTDARVEHESAANKFSSFVGEENVLELIVLHAQSWKY